MDHFDEQIAVAELADELGAYKSVVFKIAKRLGIRPSKRKDPERGNQKVSFITHPEADRIRGEYSTTTPEEGLELQQGVGLFYVIQLEPEFDPGRFKVGFTTDLPSRLRHHRCSAPFATCIRTWPCRRVWERAAIDCVTASADQLHTEVFRAGSLDAVFELAEKFFGVMPGLEFVEEADEG